MSKAIKFFLQFHDQEIKNIEDIRQNFHADEILRLYHAGILERWLRTCGYVAECEKVAGLGREQNSRQLLSALAEILLENPANFDLDMWASYVDYREEVLKKLDWYVGVAGQRDAIIQEYHKSYAQLKTDLVQNRHDMYFLREKICEISELYMSIFIVDYDACLRLCKEFAPITLLFLLSNAKMRAWIEENDKFKQLAVTISEVYKEIMNYFPSKIDKENSNIKTLLRECFKDTEATWDDIEPDGSKQLMILSLPPGAKVRSRCRIEVTDDVKRNLFPIVSGIDYNSSTTSDALVYMEV